MKNKWFDYSEVTRVNLKPGFTISARLHALPTISTRGGATRLVNRLNQVAREFFFKPKSAGGRARRKGHQFERDCAILFRAVFPKARRHLEYQDAHAIGVDLEETGALKIQCKKFRGYAPLTAIEEVQCERWLGEMPCLVTAGDGKEAIAAVYLDDFLALLKNQKEP